jgi:hypothetical protein
VAIYGYGLCSGFLHLSGMENGFNLKVEFKIGDMIMESSMDF